MQVSTPIVDFESSDEPEPEISSSSRAKLGHKLGHFNFRAETELTILTICTVKSVSRVLKVVTN